MLRFTCLIAVILLFAGCAPVAPVESPMPVAPLEPIPDAVEQPIEQAGAEESAIAPTEDEILAATRAVYESYMSLSAQELTAEDEASYRERMFTNLAQTRWGITFDGGEWATDFFYWLGSFPIDEESELSYLLLPYGSTDGAYTEAYHGALALQFMAHPYSLLRLIAMHEDSQYFCGGLSYGSYPLQLELHALLLELQADPLLTRAEQEAVAYTLERMIDLYGQGDDSWAEQKV